MKPTDDIDQLLHEAGSRWRARQPAAPEPDVARMRRAATTISAVPLGRLLVGFGTAAVILVLLIVSLPNRGDPARPATSPSGPLATNAALSPGPTQVAPKGPLTWFETVRLSEDRRTVHLTFTGGAPYSADNPCSVDYAASAEVVGSVLEVAIWEVDHPDRAVLPPGAGCPAIGYARELDVQLPQPFTGYEVHDLAGYVHFLSRPDNLAQLQLPEEWLLRSEETLSESPTGRWRQTYSPHEDPPGGGRPGALDFIQAFNAPAYVEGTFEQPAVEVNGSAARLWTSPEDGELVLVWRLGTDGLALVANEQDFSLDELIALAETARLPDAIDPEPSVSPDASISPQPSASPAVPSASPSSDGLPAHLADLDWRTVTQPFTGPLGSQVLGLFRNEGGNIVAWGPEQEVGDGGYAMVSFWHSRDGDEWREVKLGDWGQFIRATDVANSAAGVVAVGSLEDEAMIWWSPDAESWQQATVTPASGWSRTSIAAVAANEQGFLAVGRQRRSMAAWFSADGRSWRQVGGDLGAGTLHDVTVLPDGRFVAVGVDESRRDWDAASWTASADGSEWRSRESNRAVAGPNDELLLRVWPYRGGLLALANHHDTEERISCQGPCIDDSWRLYTSTDGSRWQEAAEIPEAGRPNAPLELWEYSAIVAWGEGLLAVGAGTDWQVRLWYSADGVSWEPIGEQLLVNGEPAPGYQIDTIYALLVDGERLIVGGDLGDLDLDGFVMIGEP